MRDLVTGKQMKDMDCQVIGKVGIPSLVLMERAALAVTEEIQKAAQKTDCIWAVCGIGNNGADGVAVARMLWLLGYRVEIILSDDAEVGTEELRLQLQIANQLKIPVFAFHDFIPGQCDVLVDAVFGVGLSRMVEGTYWELMEFIAGQCPKKVVAVDIPSGIHSDTGAVMGLAVRADVTVTFGFEKLGTALYPGREYAGTVLIREIGFPSMKFMGTIPEAFTLERTDLNLIPDRAVSGNKGSFGKVLIIGGSLGMAGAAYLSALAAYRTGAGLVRFMTVRENCTVLQELLPEAILTTYEVDEAIAGGEAFAESVREACEWASVIVVGPGLSTQAYVRRLVREVLENAYVPLVIDADALNIISKYPELTGYFTENIIITPHVGEMARLTGRTVAEIQSDLPSAAKAYRDRWGVTCVLKDAATVVALKDGRLYVNGSGNPSMAKAGSGDVLTGIIAGLLALGMEADQGAVLGVYLHGLAGDCAREIRGEHGILARELADHIPGRKSKIDLEAERL